MIRAHKLTARPLTARKLIAYKLGQGPVSGSPIPPLAIRDRTGTPILDRAGNTIELRAA